MDSDICIIGGGAVGATLAYFLYRAGVTSIPVYYRSWDTVSSIVEQKGIRVSDRVRGSDVVVPVTPRHYTTPIDKCRFILNTVKAYSVQETLDLMSRLLESSGVIIMLQNGFGSLELAEEKFGSRAAGGVVYFGAERVSANHVVYHGGETIIAGCRLGLCTELMELNRIFRQSGLDFRVVSNLDYYRWLKLALNAVVNPITAIARSRNSIVLTKPGLELASLILAEFTRVAEKHGYKFNTEKLLEHITSGVRATGDNISSMAQDVLKGSITEVDYINGFIARELGEELSVNRIITLIIHLIEQGTRATSSS
ncbi:MAG: 2-dehydropantoate 2-reductase [Desulfurococcus sp.]|nr:2-dehydropantoate 2-reductase [Desulfurococcus sp.]